MAPEGNDSGWKPLEAVGLEQPPLLSWVPLFPPSPTVWGPSPSSDAHPLMLPSQASFSARLECPEYPFPGHKGHPAQVPFVLELGGRPRDHWGPLPTHLKQDYLNPLCHLKLRLLGSGTLSGLYQAHQDPNYLLILASPVP